jgi:hypothetical protein
MQKIAKGGSRAARGRWAAVPLLLVALLAVLAAPAAAAPAAEVILLPGASSAEGIAAAGGASFYAGDLFRGDIFRGDLHHGTVERFIHALPGRMAVGMAADPTHRLLFVAGGFGHAYVYDTATGATVAAYRLADPAGSFVNDVTLTHQGAWFTDSLQAQLYFIPVSPLGVPGPPRTLALRGPAADTGGAVNLNGIAATPDGTTLIVGHTGNGELYTVDRPPGPVPGSSGSACPTSTGCCWRGAVVGGAEPRRPARPDPAAPAPDLRGGGAGHHRRPIPDADHRGPLRRSPGGGQRQVRYRLPAHRRPVRGGPDRPVTKDRQRGRPAAASPLGPVDQVVAGPPRGACAATIQCYYVLVVSDTG